MRKLTVLITGCSKHSKEIVKNLKENPDGVPVKVVAVDMDESRILREGPDVGYVVPPITNPGYLPYLYEICKKENVDIIIPYITAELNMLSLQKDAFEDLGVKVSVSNWPSIQILNDKVQLHKHFSEFMPSQSVVRNDIEYMAAMDDLGYPNHSICCKVSNKCGGTGFCVIDDEKCLDISKFNKSGEHRYISSRELQKIVRGEGTEIILQEYVPGLDYSVCVLADHGEARCMVGYAGYEMQYGAVINGEILKNENAYKMAEYITEQIGLDGNACFDFILSDPADPENSDAVLLECNPRINASIAFCKEAGADLIWMRCKQLMGEEIPEVVDINYGLRMQKFYEAKYYV